VLARLLDCCIDVLAVAVAITAPLLGCTPAEPMISVEGGRLQARRLDGSPLPPAALVGLELSIRDHLDRTTRVRIDDEAAPYGALAAYEVSWLDEASGGWLPLCERGLDGRRVAVALPGRWRDAGAGSFVEDPHDFTLTCTGGSNGKCARMGYAPGTRTRDGESLTPYFEACVRMMRADYCGDGRSHTRTGVPVELGDRDGRRTRHPGPGMAFEAVWGRQGAICVRRPRDPARTTLPQLAERCPRLAPAMGEHCREDALATRPDALLTNHSPAPDDELP
jgi:hypothetical protein